MNYTYTTLLMPPLIIIFAYLFFGIWDFLQIAVTLNPRHVTSVASRRLEKLEFRPSLSGKFKQIFFSNRDYRFKLEAPGWGVYKKF